MGIPIPGKDGFYIETGPSLSSQVMVVNPCHAEFILGNLEIYLSFLSFLDPEMAQVKDALLRKAGMSTLHTINS